MKDTLITAQRKKREILYFGLCLTAAVLVNLGAILYFGTPWYELFTQVGYTLLVAIVLYAVTALVRFVIHLVRKA